MKCFYCGEEYDANSFKTCPRCNAPHYQEYPTQQPNQIIVQEKKKHGCLTKILIALGICFLLLIIVSCFAGTSDEKTSSATNNIGTSDSVSAEANNNVGNFIVEYKNAKVVKDDAKDVIIVDFIFTNNSRADISFNEAIYDIPFQEGVELKDVTFTYNIRDDYSFNESKKKIKPGKSLELQKAYYLNDLTSTIEIELSAYYSTKTDHVITIKLK